MRALIFICTQPGMVVNLFNLSGLKVKQRVTMLVLQVLKRLYFLYQHRTSADSTASELILREKYLY